MNRADLVALIFQDISKPVMDVIHVIKADSFLLVDKLEECASNLNREQRKWPKCFRNKNMPMRKKKKICLWIIEIGFQHWSDFLSTFSSPTTFILIRTSIHRIGQRGWPLRMGWSIGWWEKASYSFPFPPASTDRVFCNILRLLLDQLNFMHPCK